MSGIDSLIEHQGFYDYINHFISGSVLVIGIEIIARTLHFSAILGVCEFIGLLPISKDMNEFLWNVCVISLFVLIAFLAGVAVQDLYGIIYKDNREICAQNEKNSDDVQHGGILQRHNFKEFWKNFRKYAMRLFYKTTVQSCVKNIFSESGPITNAKKRDWYQKLAKDFISQTSTLSGDVDSLIKQEDVLSYFFAHCVYYIQVKNQNKKTEKLRDIEGLSASLSLIFLGLTIFSFITIFINSCQIVLEEQSRCKEILWSITICFICAIYSVLMDCRTEKSMNNRIRMTLSIYDIEKRQETEGEVPISVYNNL